jgi:hypothetical protein
LVVAALTEITAVTTEAAIIKTMVNATILRCICSPVSSLSFLIFLQIKGFSLTYVD